MSDETDVARTSLREVRRGFARIAVEILVGFIGVYAAFALTAYHERQDLVERRHQIKKALIIDIDSIAHHAQRDAPGYLAFLGAFDSSVAAGNPRPHPFTEPVGLQDHVWEATKQAGGLSIIDVPTFYLLSEFYNANSNMYAQYAQLRDLSISEIYPRMSQGPRAFFVPGTTTLFPVFGIYRTGLRRLGAMNRSLALDGDSLIRLLARDTL